MSELRKEEEEKEERGICLHFLSQFSKLWKWAFCLGHVRVARFCFDIFFFHFSINKINLYIFQLIPKTC